jgi:flagellar motility protein MotE (MotC chaperone)
MNSSPTHTKKVRFRFASDKRCDSTSSTNRHSSLWTLIGGVFGSTILLWVMVQLGQASSEPKAMVSAMSQTSSNLDMASPVQPAEKNESGVRYDEKLLSPPASQGPAIDVPREVLEMLEQRKRDLDQREEAIRRNEQRLTIVRIQIEELLEQNEALEKKIQSAQAKEDRSQAKVNVEKERLAQEERTRLGKMYESMPSEDAAARLERMPDRRALEILRLVKSKTAGAILSQVKADRAAKLTEQLLAQMP